MRQELVFIGQNLNQNRMREALNACLLSNTELLEGMEAWRHFPAPFPA